MTEAPNDAATVEKTVSEIMRGVRDEKVRLDAANTNLSKQVIDLKQQMTGQFDRNEQLIRDILHRHAEEVTILSEERDAYLRRATQLETDLRSLGAIISDALTTHPIFERSRGNTVQDQRQGVASDRRPQMLDRSQGEQERTDVDEDTHPWKVSPGGRIVR